MTLSNIKQFISAGFDMAQWAVRASGGYHLGPTGTIAQGSHAAMSRLYGAKTADVSIPEGDVVPITGDDGLLGTFIFASTDPITFTMEVGQADLSFAAQSQGLSLYTVDPYYSMNLIGIDAPVYEDVMLLLTSQAKSAESNQEGSGYHHVLLPWANVFYLGVAFNERGEKTFRYQITTNKSKFFPWGQLLNEVAIGTRAYTALEWFTERRITLETFVNNGAANSFVLTRAPVDAQHVLAWRNGVPLTIAVTPTTRTTAFAAGTAGDVDAYLYEYA